MPDAGGPAWPGQHWMWVAGVLTRPDGCHDEVPAFAVRPRAKKLVRVFLPIKWWLARARNWLSLFLAQNAVVSHRFAVGETGGLEHFKKCRSRFKDALAFPLVGIRFFSAATILLKMLWNPPSTTDSAQCFPIPISPFTTMPISARLRISSEPNSGKNQAAAFAENRFRCRVTTCGAMFRAVPRCPKTTHLRSMPERTALGMWQNDRLRGLLCPPSTE